VGGGEASTSGRLTPSQPSMLLADCKALAASPRSVREVGWGGRRAPPLGEHPKPAQGRRGVYNVIFFPCCLNKIMKYNANLTARAFNSLATAIVLVLQTLLSE
jgi:hypothetical protein